MSTFKNSHQPPPCQQTGDLPHLASDEDIAFAKWRRGKAHGGVGLSCRKRIIFFLAAVMIGVILFVPIQLSSPAPVDRLIRIEAGMFEYSPSELTVNPGDRVTVELVSTDVVHGLSVDGYGLDMQADPGQSMRATFTADKPGVFRFRCSTPCGNLHPFMIGKLRVGPNLLLLRGAALGVLGVFAALAARRVPQA